MLNKIAFATVVLLLMIQSCLEDREPLSGYPDTYLRYYNNLLESYDLQWELDEVVIDSGQSYGVPDRERFYLDYEEQEVLIRTRNSENDLLIDSLYCFMGVNGKYMIAIMGTEMNPYLIFEPMDIRIMSNVRFRFLHTSEAMGPVDIYIGGDQPEHLALTALDYTQVSEYLHATEEEIGTSIIVTPASKLPNDSTILEYTANANFQSPGIYLCILEHVSSSNESSFQMQIDPQPRY